MCAFAKKCPNDNCTQIVDYTEDIVKYPIISAIADEEIKKDVFGYADLDSKSLSNTISLPETKEMAAEVMSQNILTVTSTWQYINKENRNLQRTLI